MNNDVFTLDDNNNAAIRTIGVKGIAESNSPSVFTEDENGNACVRVTGGGDAHNKGYFATPEALEEAYATAEPGDYAIVGSTDTVWVWDTDTSAWVDTDTKGQVTPDMIIVKSSTIPSASTTPAGAVYQYTGTTTASYTHGYIYENKETISYTDSVEFNPASISGTTVTATTGALAGLCAEYGSGNITDIIKGTLTYDLAGGLLVFVGLDDTDTQVCSFQLYTQDYEDAGFTFTGTLQDGDVIAFTCTISEVASYTWERIDVQPTPSELPSQTGQSGKFLTTDGTDASWATINALQNTATGTNSLTILGTATNQLQALNVGVNSFAYKGAASVGYSAEAGGDYSACIGHQSHAAADYSIAVGYNAHASYPNGNGAIAIGKSSYTSFHYAIAIGANTNAGGRNSIAIGSAVSGAASATAHGAIQLGGGTNSEAGTFCVGLYDGSNSYNYKMLEFDGTIPADRTSPITSISTATVTQALAANTIYNCTVDMTSIEITLPATPTANFCAQLNFTSGSTPTAFTSPAGMVWLGDDVSTTFVPVANKRYAIMVFFDGVSTRGIVQAA